MNVWVKLIHCPFITDFAKAFFVPSEEGRYGIFLKVGGNC